MLYFYCSYNHLNNLFQLVEYNNHNKHLSTDIGLANTKIKGQLCLSYESLETIHNGPNATFYL